MSSPSSVEEAPWRAGLHSIRALLRPGLALQAAAVALVLAAAESSRTGLPVKLA